MDFSQILAKEIARKKATVNKALDDENDDYAYGSSVSSKPKKKYIKKSDLVRAEQELEEEGRREVEKKLEEKERVLKRRRDEEKEEFEIRRKKREALITQRKEDEKRKEEERKEMEEISKLPESKLSDKELKIKLENWKIPNEILETESRNGLIKKLHKLVTKEKKKKRIEQEDLINMEIKERDITENSLRVSIQLCATIRTILSEWKAVLESRDDTTDEAREVLRQTVSYCKPLLNKLRGDNGLPEKLFQKLATLIMNIQQHKYREANAVYIKMSIGNAAWPVGVTAVGIHARSARERITGENNEASGVDVAHILDDDDTRQWIIAIKRFITFAEAHLKDKSFEGADSKSSNDK